MRAITDTITDTPTVPTVSIDSAAADSVSVIIPAKKSFVKSLNKAYRQVDDSLNAAVADSFRTPVFEFNIIDYLNQQPSEAADTVILTETEPVTPGWTIGLEGSTRQNKLNSNSGILTLIVLLFVAISLSFKDYRKLFSKFAEEMRSSRKSRGNAFDERSSHETRLMCLSILQYIVCGGIMLFALAARRGGVSPDDYGFTTLVSEIGVFAAYYIFDIAAYSVVGYTFAGIENMKILLRRFNSSQSILGVTLALPALIVIFYPLLSDAMIYTSVTLYVLARLLFIIKGFDIFFTNIFSLLYFILYLCALEIIPLIYVYHFALLLI